MKRLNEKPYFDEQQRVSVMSDISLPPFQNMMPVKSMDVSEVGFRERYQSAITQKKQVNRQSNVYYILAEDSARDHYGRQA